jgi:HSP20 family protein
MDFPGLSKDAVHLKVDTGVLTVSGERNRPEPAGAGKEDYYEYYERSIGNFTRMFRLPSHVDAEGIRAVYQNGVLEVHLRKSEEAKPKTINIS